MAWSGIDHEVHVFWQRETHLPAWGQVAYYSGYSLPVVFPLVLYGEAAIENESELWGAAAATTQAVGISLALTGVLKIATGRPFPTHGEDPNAPNRLEHPEYAHEFHPFGGFSGTWAWPSGHTVGAFTLAAVLTGYYPDQLWIPLTTYPIAVAIAAGMVSGEYHWASDAVAGALIGQTIGYTVGRAFRRRANDALAGHAGGRRVPGRDARIQFGLLPVMGGSSCSILLHGTF